MLIDVDFFVNPFYYVDVTGEEKVPETFGQVIRKARKEKGYSQRELAKIVGLDFTYLSKLENARSDYPPKEAVIRNLAKELELDAEELIFLAGRVPEQDENFLKQNYKAMPALFRRLQSDPDYTRKIFDEVAEADESEEDWD